MGYRKNMYGEPSQANSVVELLVSLYGCHHVVYKNLHQLLTTWVDMIIDPPSLCTSPLYLNDIKDTNTKGTTLHYLDDIKVRLQSPC